MIRVFEIPDLHFDNRWADVLDRCVAAVERQAIETPPDLIALPGDLHNKPLYAADRSGYSRLLDLVRRLLAIAPVAAIQGTPSHDAPGAYAPLEELGLVLLHPGRVYFLDDEEGIVEYHRQASSKAVLFGIPELDKDWAESLDADERAGDVLTALGRYVDEFIAPHRSARYELPAIALLHGVVSDSRQEHETDVIKRASSLLIHTEILERAGVDRWCLGDIHTPWESERISAGYAGFTGMDDNPWGKTGFFPHFNVTDVSVGQAVVDSAPYGTPKRTKITAPVAAYHPSVAYWLDSEVDDPSLDPAKHGAHPWSRLTFEPKKEETRRVTKEEAEKAAGLGDLLGLMVPEEATPERRAMADSIDAQADATRTERRVCLQTVEVVGATFFRGQTVRLDVEALPSGLTAITGDNGAGKSSLLAFCSPYPVVIGKDTESGRVSAIKEFFAGQDSHVEKLFTVNGVTHRHLITIKAAGKASAKTECYLYIDGENVLETTNFDAMLARCELEYGPLEDYLRTYQYVQPQQGGAPSGLMSAGATDLRNVVQNIAGIDRSVERRLALDAVGEFEAKAREYESQAAGLEMAAEDVDALIAQAQELDEDIEQRQEDQEKAGTDLAAARVENRRAQGAKARNDQATKALGERDAAVWRIETTIKTEDARAGTLRDDVAKAPQLRERLEAEDKAREEYRKAGETAGVVRGRNSETTLAHERLMTSYRDLSRQRQDIIRDRAAEVKAVEDGRQRTQATIREAEEMADTMADPCEACGHVSEANAKKVASYRQKAEHYRGELENLVASDPPVLEAEPIEPIAPVLEAVPPVPDFRPMDPGTYGGIKRTLENLAAAGATLDETAKAQTERRAELARLNAQEFTIDTEAEAVAIRADSVLTDADRAAREIATHLATLAAQSDAIGDRILRAKEAADRLAALHDAKVKALAALEDWKWLAAMLAPAKLPAFELELVLDSIDERATRNIRPFREGRYRIRTETQREGAAGRVDKFQIVIHDGETGAERSFLKHSPGEKAFAALAYQRALIAVREERTGVTYSPHVLDEADGPVQPARVPEFYEMQAETVGDGRALVVSHAPDAQYYIGNAVSVEELKV